MSLCLNTNKAAEIEISTAFHDLFFDVGLDFVLIWKLVRFKYALYAISVRQTEVLPPTSFRLRLTTDALALANSSYCQACSGLSPPSYYACRAHKRNWTPASIPIVSKLVSSYGAGGGTRTHTVSLPTDFESVTSANSITPAITE